MNLGIEGRAAFVTGGTSNIGRGIVLSLASEGADLAIIHSRDEEQAARVAEEARSAGSRTVRCYSCDVTDSDAATQTVNRIASEFGRIDILVNSVGYAEVHTFTRTNPDFWDRIISLNYRSVLAMTHAVVPYMIEGRWGRIVSVGSDAARAGEEGEAVYSGTKNAVAVFTKSLAREVARYGITANVVNPGLIVPKEESEMSAGSMWHGQMGRVFGPAAAERIARTYPLRRLGTPREIGDAVAFLASERASYITGQTLSVSGGYTMY